MRSSRSAHLLFAALALLPVMAQAHPVLPPLPRGVVAPHAYVRRGIRWRLRHLPRVHVVVQPRAQVYYAPPAPQGVYVPPPPPQGVYVAPAAPQPVYQVPAAPQQPYYGQPCYSAPCQAQPPCCYQGLPPPAPLAPPALVPARRPRPDFVPRVGLGVTGEGLFTLRDPSYRGFGILGQLRVRAARHLTLEFMSGYERTRDAANLVRRDVPTTFGLLVPFLAPRHILSPYLVFAGGINFADARLEGAATPADRRIQAIGQIGAGLEIRLGQHFALNGDIRVEGRWNLNGTNTRSAPTGGLTVQPIQNTLGMRIGGGATVYF